MKPVLEVGIINKGYFEIGLVDQFLFYLCNFSFQNFMIQS